MKLAIACLSAGLLLPAPVRLQDPPAPTREEIEKAMAYWDSLEEVESHQMIRVTHDRKPVANVPLKLVTVPERLPVPDLKQSGFIERLVESGDVDARTDEHGRLLVEAPGHDEELLVVASTGGFWGYAKGTRSWFPGGDGKAYRSIEVELYEDRALEVEVVDRLSRPVAGVPVGLSTAGRPMLFAVTATTGEDGVARLLHVPAHTAGTRKTDWQIGFAFPAPGSKAVRCRLDGDERVRLAMPPAGSLRVLVRTADGGPYSGSGTVSVTSSLDPGATSGLQAFEHTQYGIPIVGGVATVPHLGLGLSVKVGCSTDPLHSHRADAIARGPERDGQSVEVRLELPPEPLSLRGTVLRVDGTPLRASDLRLFGVKKVQRFENREHAVHVVGEMDARLPLQALKTDADGTISARLRWKADELDYSELILFHAELGWASFVLPRPIPSELDFGRLGLAPLVPIARGTVVDHQGDPVDHARVSARSKAEGAWASMVFETETDEEGRFELRGLVPETVRVIARGPFVDGRSSPLRSETLEISGPEPATRLVLHAGGTIAGSVVLPEGAPPSGHWSGAAVRLLYANGHRQPLRWAAEPSDIVGSDAVRPDGDGSFALWDLAPAVVTVEVGLRGRKKPLLVIPDVKISLDEETRDPRLQEIRLDRICSVFHLDAVDLAGKAVPGVAVKILDDNAAPNHSIAFRWLDFIAEKPQLRVLVSAEGYRSLERTIDAGSTRLVLPPPIPLMVRAPDDWAPIGSSLRLHLRVESLDSRWSEDGDLQLGRDATSLASEAGNLIGQDAAQELLTEKREARFSLPSPGRYRVTWSVLTRNRYRTETVRDNGVVMTSYSNRLFPGEPQVITVSENGATHRLVPDMDWMELQERLSSDQ